VTPPGETVLYFAYGANVHPGWLGRRAPAARLVGSAALPGHRLAFRKRGRDGAGRSDACPTDDVAVELPGVLYELPAADLARLGAAGSGYALVDVTVRGAGGWQSARTWRALPEAMADGLSPWHWYLALIRAGAALHGFPPDYCRWLASVPAREDPDRARAALAYEVIAAASSGD
jgi:gamma-glutamylcyclotransferase